jgi:hypothetical protein
VAAAYALDELGSLQFERLCTALLGEEAGLTPEWDEAGIADAPDGVRLPALGVALAGPAEVRLAWIQPHRPVPLADVLRRRRSDGHEATPASRLVLTNAAPGISAGAGAPHAAVLGPWELAALIDAHAAVRFRLPSVLGLRDLADLVPDGLHDRSSLDAAAAHALARVFAPTRAYERALAVVRRHGFAVLTGPPEMGKTAIARTIALAALSAGWEAHECIRPEQLCERYARDRPQVFVADDAFGSTEYRPDAAERWALELDRVLRATDERHWLLWTSRPAPLRAGLRRIHREHGVERWPQPAEVQVSAADLSVEEKALILFRHAKAARLPPELVAVVRRRGREIVDHPHLTPERIRRLVSDRLAPLAAGPAGELAELTALPDDRLAAVIATEIREPTEAMATSFRALPAEHRALLVALVDAPPGPVGERDLASAMRRHADGGLPRAPGELIDRLVDHFLRPVPPDAVTWVHPSWRDLVIDELAASAEARHRFLGSCGLDGLLLALSVGGGGAGERALPLLVGDADWDAATGRLERLLPTLGDPSALRLLTSLRAACEEPLDRRARSEAAALAGRVLELLRATWDAGRTPVTAGLLEAWYELAALCQALPPAQAVARAWVEVQPSPAPDLSDPAEVASLDEWSRLVAVLARHDPARLAALGFPAGQAGAIEALLGAFGGPRGEPDPPLARIARRLAPALPEPTRVLLRLAAASRVRPAEEDDLPAAVPAPPPPADALLVERILADL